jgi:hypothetical protein
MADDIAKNLIIVLERIAKALESMGAITKDGAALESRETSKESPLSTTKEEATPNIPVVGDIYKAAVNELQEQSARVMESVIDRASKVMGISSTVDVAVEPRKQLEEIAGMYSQQGADLSKEQLQSMYGVLRKGATGKARGQLEAIEQTGGATGAVSEIMGIDTQFAKWSEKYIGAPLYSLIDPNNYEATATGNARDAVSTYIKKVGGAPSITGQ